MPWWPVSAVRGHDNVERGRARARDELFDSVEDVARAVGLRPRDESRGVGTRPGLGEAVAAEGLHGGKLGDALGALGVGAERVDHPHDHVLDGDVGGDGRVGLREFLEDQRRVRA